MRRRRGAVLYKRAVRSFSCLSSPFHIRIRDLIRSPTPPPRKHLQAFASPAIQRQHGLSSILHLRNVCLPRTGNHNGLAGQCSAAGVHCLPRRRLHRTHRGRRARCSGGQGRQSVGMHLTSTSPSSTSLREWKQCRHRHRTGHLQVIPDPERQGQRRGNRGDLWAPDRVRTRHINEIPARGMAARVVSGGDEGSQPNERARWDDRVEVTARSFLRSRDP